MAKHSLLQGNTAFLIGQQGRRRVSLQLGLGGLDEVIQHRAVLLAQSSDYRHDPFELGKALKRFKGPGGLIVIGAGGQFILGELLDDE